MLGGEQPVENGRGECYSRLPFRASPSWLTSPSLLWLAWLAWPIFILVDQAGLPLLAGFPLLAVLVLGARVVVSPVPVSLPLSQELGQLQGVCQHLACRTRGLAARGLSSSMTRSCSATSRASGSSPRRFASADLLAWFGLPLQPRPSGILRP